ncbi:phosphocholine cytidylyltransferase family protein [bacterium]|nr:phosphocholine cytidylyltransferase family protein [bacterium]
MKVLILAAGIGSRLGKPFPKPLTKLQNDKSIMQTQLENFTNYVDLNDIFVVVGFKKDLIMEVFPELTYVYNDYFDSTNTSKSLLRGLKKLKNTDVLWINGDVVFDHKVLERIINFDGSCMAVNTSKVADEEVKYLVNADGTISQVSKIVVSGLGEAVGINKIKSKDINLLIDCLEHCKDSDYFERGIELAIEKGFKIYPLDISDLMCMEIDFLEDLEQVNLKISAQN